MFKVDMHIHSVLGGDAIIQPDEVVACAINAGLDAICITEHHSFELSQPFDAISTDTGFPIIRGMEYKAKEGHLLVFGVNMSRTDMPSQMPMQQVVQWVANHGGIAIPAHPFQPDMFGGMLGEDLLTLKQIIAVETMNGSASNDENKKAENAAQKMGWRMVGGSDAHGPNSIGKAYTVFQDKINNADQLVEALKTSNYYPCHAHEQKV